MCKMPALVLWESALSLVLATFPFIFLLIPSCQPAGSYPFLTDSSFHSYHQSLVFVSYRAGVDAYFPVCLHRLNKIQQSLKESYFVQITEALLSEPGDIRRFVQQAVDHWPRLLAFHFTLHSAEGNINGQQIHAFCTSFYERITERNHTTSPSSPVVLRWLREQHGGATIRCLLLLSQTSICHPRASVTVDEQCSQVVDLLQQTWRGMDTGGQCRVERCFRVTRPDTSEQYVALKTAVQSLMPLVIATIIR
ncbi:Uncharacterised protein [Escherichia coli]|nr:Uncharacterised protein [Escherichia coli]SQP69731.1 Uncharacterised protein [Escherichia coli]SQZ58039.1 Uncharacterised protein [Escherichia coli]SQZ84302.1 Uncharacterised protein [Escherichia coli]